MKNFLITGGLGYIGTHTAVTLLNNDFNVFIVDSLENSSLKSLDALHKIYNNKLNDEKLRFFNGDIRDSKFLDSVFKKAKILNQMIDGVIHFAGLKSIKESFEKPNLYWEVNVKGTENLIQVMQDNECFFLVFSSSATVYGNIKDHLSNEKDKCNPINIYGWSKLIAEKVIEKKYLQNPGKWKIIILRYFNPIGAHNSLLIGDNYFSSNINLFPILCEVAAKKREKVYIYGNDWETEDGSAIRDYVHVMDIAEGHLLAINYLYKNQSIILKINLGSGIGYSVLEMIKLFQVIIGKTIPYSFLDKRKGEADISLADIKLSKELLNWSPKRDIKSMFKSGWGWYMKQAFN